MNRVVGIPFMLLAALGSLSSAVASTGTCLTEMQREMIRVRLAANRAALEMGSASTFSSAPSPPSSSRPSFEWPLMAENQWAGDFAVHANCNYVDHGKGDLREGHGGPPHETERGGAR